LAVENAQEVGLSCPRCDGKLLEADYQHIKIDVCNKCHGVWFDAGELAQVIDKDKEGGWFSKLFD
jgi:Zn-finger nucleic acid-binding protein